MKKLLLLGTTLFVLLVVGLGAFFILRLPPVVEQIPSSPTLLAQIQSPYDQSDVSPNSVTTIQVAGMGDSLTAIQLWVDGVPADSKTNSSSSTLFYAAFAWQPSTEGDHILIARVIDSKGNMGTSSVVRVHTKSANNAFITSIKAGEGETLESIADLFDVPLDHLTLLNPGLDPKKPLATDQEIAIPFSVPTQEILLPPTPALPTPALADEPQPPSGQTQPISPALPNPFNFYLAKNFPKLFGAAKLPIAPEVASKVEGCNVNLFITDKAKDEIGFFVYRLSPGGASFQRIATLDVNNGSLPLKFTESGLYGTSMYYIASFNAAGEAAGDIVSVSVKDVACAKPAQSSLSLTNSTITTTQAVTSLYCYTSLDGAPWNRIPAGADTFISPIKGKFDLTPHLGALLSPPPQTDVIFKMECWGWAGGALKNLGTAIQIIKAAQSGPITITGSAFSLTGSLSNEVKGKLIAKQVKPQPTPSPKPEKIISAPYGVQGWFESGSGFNKKYVVIWDWVGVSCFPPAAGQPAQECLFVSDIDGYKIHDTLGKVLKTVAGKSTKWTYMESQFPSCYLVTAFKGNLESPMSLWGCVAVNTPPDKQVTKEIAPPKNLKLTTSADECAKHYDLSAWWATSQCKEAVLAKSAVLVWDWSAAFCFPSGPNAPPTPCKYVSDINGFHVYDTYSGQPILVETISTLSQTNAIILQSNNGVKVNDSCYTVRAYKGDLESVGSNKVCYTPPPVPPTSEELTLMPSSILNIVHIHVIKNTYFGCLAPAKNFIIRSVIETMPTGSDDGFSVSFIYRTPPFLLCNKTSAQWMEGAATFPIEQLKGMTIEKAELFSTSDSGFAGLGTKGGFEDKGLKAPITASNVSCTKAIYSYDAWQPISVEDGVTYLYGSDKLSSGEPALKTFLTDAVNGQAGAINTIDLTKFMKEKIQKINPKYKSTNSIHFYWQTHEGFQENNDMCLSGLGNLQIKVTVKK